MTAARADAIATLWWRVTVLVTALVLLCLFGYLYHTRSGFYIPLLRVLGERPSRFPFIDMHGVLSALECARQGYDVYRFNPCDIFDRAFVYSPLILSASFLPVTFAWNNWVGVTVTLLSFGTVASLPSPRDRREWLVMGFATFSSMVVFAVERGNIDLAIFVLLGAAGWLAVRSGVARAAAYGVILFCAGLKYYPVVALIVAVREKPRRFAAVVAVCVVLTAIFILHYRDELTASMALIPTGSYFNDMFGAVNLPFGLAKLAAMRLGATAATSPTVAALPWLVLVVLLLSSARQALATAGSTDVFAELAPARAVFLMIGGSVIAGCFFAEQNIDYRGIYLLFTLPGLLALGRSPESGRRFLVAAWMILFLMWSDMFREALQRLEISTPGAAGMAHVALPLLWLARELIWWRVIAVLCGVMLGVAIRSEMGHAVAARFAVARWVAH